MKMTAAFLSVLVLMLPTIVASPAHAMGTYDVVSCDAAGGPNRAWRTASFDPQLFVAREWCPAFGSSGGMGVRSTVMRLKAAQLSSAWWRFDAPPGTSIVSMDWAGRQATSAPGWATRIQTSSGTLAGCGPSARPCVREWVRGDVPDHFDTPGAAWVRVGVVCLQLSGCQTSVRSGVPAADAATSYSRIKVADASPPQVAVSGRAWRDGWTGSAEDLVVAAQDASGISEARMEVDGHVSSRIRYACDFTRARPCSDRTATFTIDPKVLTDGRHHVVVIATDAAGNQASSVSEVAVDSHAPSAAVPPSVDPSGGWQDGRHFGLTWPVPEQDGGSPVQSSVLRVCRTSEAGRICLPEQLVDVAGKASLTAGVDLPIAGEWTATVSFADAANPGIRGTESPPVTMRWDPSAPGPGTISVPEGWLTREAARVARASVSLADGVDPPISGISGWAVSFAGLPGGQPELLGQSVSVGLGGLPEGVSTLTARSFSGAGIGSRAVASARVRIDATAPKVDLSGVPSSLWAKGPVTLTASAVDQPGLSGMESGEGDGSGLAAGVAIHADGEEIARVSGERVSGEISEDGVHRVWATARDAAGNSGGTGVSFVRIDSTPPERAVFLPQDAADPRIVRVDAGDTGSGLASARIEVRPISGGQWTPLPTSLEEGRAEALIDDSLLAGGLWEMRAVILDNAGNQAIADRVMGGDPAVVTLPLRLPSRLSAGLAASPRLPDGANSASVMRAANGAVAYATGLLEDAEGLGVPRSLVRVRTRPAVPGSSWTEEGNAMTDRNGRFSLRLDPGPSREVRLVFGGNRATLAAEATMVLRVSSHSTISVNPKVVRVGRSVMFRGHIAGGWLPGGGKLVMVQAWLKNVGWQTFAAVRANQDGDWAAPYRFRATTGRVAYQIRAVVPGESGYPFEGSETQPVKVTAVG